MFFDSTLHLKTDFSIAGATTNAPTAISDVVNLSALRNVGAGDRIVLRITCTEAPVAYVRNTDTDPPTAVVLDHTGELFTDNAHGLLVGTPIQLQATALPSGNELAEDTTYWVTNVTTNTFQVAETVGDAMAGTAFAFSGSNGTAVTYAVWSAPVAEFQFLLVTATNAALTASSRILGQSPSFGSSYHRGGAMPAVGDWFDVVVPAIDGNSYGSYLGVMYRNTLLSMASYAPAFTTSYFSAGKFNLSLVTVAPEHGVYPAAV